MSCVSPASAFLDRTDDEFGLARQYPASHLLVGFDRTIQSLAIAVDPWDFADFLPREPEAYEGNSFVGFAS